MTPATSVLARPANTKRHQRYIHTKRVPENQGELGHLLTLLAELKQGRFTRCFVQQVSNVLEGTAVIFGHGSIKVILLRMGSSQGIYRVVGGRYSVVVLLLCGIGRGRSRLSMMLVGSLLMNPGCVGLGILVMSVDMGVSRHHLCRYPRRGGYRVEDGGRRAVVAESEEVGSREGMLSVARGLTKRQG